MKNFNSIYRKQQTVSVKSDSKEIQVSRNFTLSWSHYLKLMRIEDEMERRFYEVKGYWSNANVCELLRSRSSTC
jgi:hypothetical protein